MTLIKLMELKILIVLHVLGACIWVGGHLILALSVLPKALKDKDPDVVRVFEDRFERIGIPALALQIITGFWMAGIYFPVSEWLSFSDRMHIHIGIKIILIITTALLALHARIFIIPKLNSDNLNSLAWHIIAITVVALALLFTGLNFRLFIF